MQTQNNRKTLSATAAHLVACPNKDLLGYYPVLRLEEVAAELRRYQQTAAVRVVEMIDAYLDNYTDWHN